MHLSGPIRVGKIGKRCLLVGIFLLAMYTFKPFITPPVSDPPDSIIWLNMRGRRDDKHVKFPTVQLSPTPDFVKLAQPNNNNTNTNDKNNIFNAFNRPFHSYEPKEFWKRVSGLVSDVALYPDYFDVNIVLSRLATSRITHVQRFKTAGSCLKWLLELDGGKKVLFKPQLVTPKEEEDKGCNTGHEQGAYEVAAFHLLRLMGSRAVPFVAGRKVDIVTEILPLAPQDLRDTIKMDENGTACISHKCPHCDDERWFCFPDGVVMGSASFWLDQPLGGFTMQIDKDGLYHDVGGVPRESPAYLLKNQQMCDAVRELPVYNVTRYYLDLFDMALWDHVIGNFDRKHVYILDDKMDPALTILLDHGLAFCTHDVGTLSLALTQCCRVRRRTVEALRRIFPTLKSEFRAATYQDELKPLLTEKQLDKVQERIENILKQVERCLT